MTSFSLVVDGKTYAGWTEVRVQRSLDQFAHSFEMNYTDRWAEGDAPAALTVGAACQVKLDSFPLITGWLNQARISLSAGSIEATAAGRSKTGDLVDCAAIHKTGQWRNQTALKIVRDIVAPFGIPVEADAQAAADAAQVKRFDLEDGESAFDAIDRLARLRAMLPTSTTAGALRFVRLTRSNGARVLRLDVSGAIRREWENTDENRFSVYRIRSQTGRFSEDESPRRAALEAFEVSDAAVKRYRPLVVQSETGARLVELRDHATWIRNTRAAQAERVIYEFPGGLAPDGRPWEPGTFVAVDDRFLGVNEILVIAAVTTTLNNTQFTTEIQLARIEAYSTEPIPAKELSKKLKRI